MQSSASILLLAFSTMLGAQQPAPTTAATAPTRGSSYIDENGRAQITRIVPVPANVSPEAQKNLSQPVPDAPHAECLAQHRARLVRRIVA